MRLESLHSAVSAEIRKVDSSKKDTAPKATGYPRKADQASLSSGAKNASDSKASASVVAARIQSEPDVRSEKIEEVRRKLNEGFYDSSKFSDQLADKLINDFGF